MEENWDNLADDFCRFARKRPRFTVYDALIDKVVASGARTLLDFGCGPGLFLRDYAASLDIPLCGFDSAPHMVELARENCKDMKDVRITSAFQSLPPHSFDAIAQGFVWVTWKSDKECVEHLRECASALTERGKLYAVVSHPFFRNRAFSGFEMKLADKDLMRDGAPFEVTLQSDGKPTTFTDTHWTFTAMFSQMKRAGLRVCSLHEYPDINPERYPGAAFLMLVASRAP